MTCRNCGGELDSVYNCTICGQSNQPVRTLTAKTQDAPASQLKRIVSGTASEIAEKKLFEFMGKEGMNMEEAEWSGCPKWIKEAMEEYADLKCKKLKRTTIMSDKQVKSERPKIQPADIKNILEDKFEHRKDKDDLGFTGHFKLSPKEVLDVIIELAKANDLTEDVRGASELMRIVSLPKKR